MRYVTSQDASCPLVTGLSLLFSNPGNSTRSLTHKRFLFGQGLLGHYLPTRTRLVTYWF